MAEFQAQRFAQALPRFRAIKDPAKLEREINNVPGVIENGLFVGVASVVFVADPKGVRTLRPK